MTKKQREKEAHQLRRLYLMTAVALLALSPVVIGLYAIRAPISELTTAAGRDEVGQTRLDPNTATWWELTCLPGIGETRARAIVEHRDLVWERSGHARAVVFHRAEDLHAVKGLGPKTVARCAPYLYLPQK